VRIGVGWNWLKIVHGGDLKSRPKKSTEIVPDQRFSAHLPGHGPVSRSMLLLKPTCDATF
jgi:hypothetical protein